MKEILEKSDVQDLVQSFYSQVLTDQDLAPFFQKIDFETHIPKMVHFWSFVLLDEPGYKTNVTDKHMHMPLTKEHFDRWLELFHTTVNEMFIGERAEIAKQRANLIAWTIQNKTGIK